MNKKRAAPTIDFADSRYKLLHLLEDETLIIYLDSWQESPLKIIFKNTIQFCYKVGDVSKNLYEILDPSPFLAEALSHEYKDVSIPTNHPYKLFQLEDIGNFPFIQVVAESVEVLEE
jgi:hypothetical protein